MAAEKSVVCEWVIKHEAELLPSSEGQEVANGVEVEQNDVVIMRRQLEEVQQQIAHLQTRVANLDEERMLGEDLPLYSHVVFSSSGRRT